MNAKETISKYWDLRSESYNNGVSGFDDKEKAVWKREMKAVLPGEVCLTALDVGTGPGFLALILAEMGHKVTGVDISAGMILRAVENARMMDLDADFRCADAEKLPFEDESFDLLVSRHLLWTLPNPIGAVEEWGRVLKPGGKVLAIDGPWFDPSPKIRLLRSLSKAVDLITDGNTSRIDSVFSDHYDPIRRELPLYTDTKPKRICSLFEEAGLSRVSFRYLLEVREHQRAYARLSYRIRHKDPTFLVIGQKCGE